ncbi:MAG: AAA family ATPase [Bacteroidales bacterium]|nr:AAA family ATPase [Bacteroidales bacterium]
MGFREAKASKIGGKFLAYGDYGSGKSWFQLTFPNVACIDSEAGVGFYEKKPITLNNGNTYNNLKLVDNTSDLDTLEEDLDEFLDGEYDGKINTLSIDSETKFYSTMQISALEVEERRARRKGGDVDDAGISVKQWGRIKLINMKLQQAKIDLSSKGVHIVSVAQQVDIKDSKGEKVIGYKPDMHKSAGFDYDVILRFFKEKNGEEIKFFAEVIKDRTCVTKVGSIIENPCYDIWQEYFEGISSLDTNKTSYRNDLDKSTDSMIEKSDKAEDIVTEWKPLMKSITDSGNTTAVKQINAFIKENNISVKNMTAESPEILGELLDLTKSLA